jgi:hypothetical protein
MSRFTRKPYFAPLFGLALAVPSVFWAHRVMTAAERRRVPIIKELPPDPEEEAREAAHARAMEARKKEVDALLEQKNRLRYRRSKLLDETEGDLQGRAESDGVRKAQHAEGEGSGGDREAKRKADQRDTDRI